MRRTGKSVRVTGAMRYGLLGPALCVACTSEPGPQRQPEAIVERPSRVEPTPTPAATNEIRLPVAQVPTALDDPEEPEVPADVAGPRTVPPGTPPAIAKVFQRLPVAIHDRPPVGGIGASGIHVDKIWSGSAYEREGCSGEAANFSLARHGQVNVCFRVVHSRVEESVDVLWEKDGAPFRRRAMQIPDLHAYRTRAYLVLREEYIGSWKARVLSVDGVELASQAFVVAE